MKYIFNPNDNILIESFEKVLKKHAKKLRPAKTAHISADADNLYIHVELNPVNKYARSVNLFGYEKIIGEIELELTRMFRHSNVKVEIAAGGCDLEVYFFWS